jgi:hypothetical protein
MRNSSRVRSVRTQKEECQMHLSRQVWLVCGLTLDDESAIKFFRNKFLGTVGVSGLFPLPIVFGMSQNYFFKLYF